MSQIILIPAYEPDDNLISLVNAIYKKYDIVVINDGSSSEEIFNDIKKKCVVLKHVTNLGKGMAIKTGLTYIKDHYKKEDTVITVDADGQHKISDIVTVLKNCINDNELVLGVRSFDKNTPLKSKLGNYISSRLLKKETGYYLEDTQTGLRSFKVSMIPFLINIDGTRYEYEMNVLVKCIKNKINIKEIPISTIYIDSNKGSHYKPLRDSYRIYKLFNKGK